MSNTIEHVIPNNVQSLVGVQKKAGNCSFAILMIEGTGETKYYPSIKDGKYLSWDNPEYWQHKVERVRLTVRLAVSGNAVSAEDYIKNATGYEAMAIGPNNVDVYIPDMRKI